MKAQPFQCIEDPERKEHKPHHRPQSSRGFELKLAVFASFILVLLLVGWPIVSIPAGHLAVVDFFGYVSTRTIPSGMHLKMLFANVHSFSLKTQLLELTLNVPTTEGLIVELDVSILYRIDADMVRQLYLTVGTLYKDVVLLPEVTSTVRSLTASVSSKALYSASRDELSAGIKVQLNQNLRARGIEVEQAMLRKVVLPRLVTTAIEQKLMAEQDSQRMEFVLMKGQQRYGPAAGATVDGGSTTAERQEAERKRIEAQGIADFQNIVSQGISDALLEWKGIEATEKLAGSLNAKVVVVGNARNGLPLILGDGSAGGGGSGTLLGTKRLAAGRAAASEGAEHGESDSAAHLAGGAGAGGPNA
ncbi:hypothetical protein GPECTOR_70g506 [Gonium pectorale]|uniref:Band 7 domain-containing protein n=1 Tax=Gonium pectorale TaxID=33097 RepID=A0A150G431_GONPE|nr:hypothetical protein GPECTOR_70g506 [Gonium pectorale]|eukprot:KXZ44275.1 hypothetical protein GPECTOR_70g506 [Gonium pectorale]